MRLIPLVARRNLTVGGRALAVGEVFETTPLDAAVLTYQHKAAFAPRGVTASVPLQGSPATPAPEVRTRRRYRRRDMAADD